MAVSVRLPVVYSTDNAYKVRTYIDPWSSVNDRYLWVPKSVALSTVEEPAQKDILGKTITTRTIITSVKDWWYEKNKNNL